MDEVTSPAESEIQIEKIDLSEPENSGSVSVDANTVTVHPEEGAVATVNDNQPEEEIPTGFVTTRIPPYVAPEYVPEQSKMRYSEDTFLAEVLEYIKGTYGEHYANPEAQGFQLFDLWDSQGILEPICNGTATKYITRYGKKDGYNKKDLFKAIHYIILLAFATRDK